MRPPYMERTREGNGGDPLQYSCLQNATDGGAWRANVPSGSQESGLELVTRHMAGTDEQEGKAPCF